MMSSRVGRVELSYEFRVRLSKSKQKQEERRARGTGTRLRTKRFACVALCAFVLRFCFNSTLMRSVSVPCVFVAVE